MLYKVATLEPWGAIKHENHMDVTYAVTIAYYVGIMAYAQTCLLQQRCWHSSLSATAMNDCQELLSYYVAQNQVGGPNVSIQVSSSLKLQEPFL